MNDPVPSRDNSSGIGDLNVRMFFNHMINGFTDDGNISFHGTAQHQVAPIFLKLPGGIIKK